jgi:hypothetical protein
VDSSNPIIGSPAQQGFGRIVSAFDDTCERELDICAFTGSLDLDGDGEVELGEIRYDRGMLRFGAVVVVFLAFVWVYRAEVTLAVVGSGLEWMRDIGPTAW